MLPKLLKDALLGAIVLWLIGCSDQLSDSNKPVEMTNDDRQATVFDSQLDVLNDASQIEQLTLDAAAKQRAQIDAQGQ